MPTGPFNVHKHMGALCILECVVVVRNVYIYTVQVDIYIYLLLKSMEIRHNQHNIFLKTFYIYNIQYIGCL